MADKSGRADDANGALSSLPAKTPPAEKPKSIRTRRLILFAFWFVVAVFGVPHWIQTTSIHRSSLPLESMNSWADGSACRLEYPFRIRLNTNNDHHEATTLAAELEKLLKAGSDLSLYDFVVTADGNGTAASGARRFTQHSDPKQTEYQEDALTVVVKADSSVKSTESTLRSWVPVLEVRHNSGRTVDAATLAPFIAQEIQRTLVEEQDTISHLLEGTPFFKTSKALKQLRPETKASLDAKKTRAFKYASTYHLTFSLFTSSALPSSWDIENALERTIQPLISRFSSVGHFTIDTQVQLYASFSPSIAGPQYDASAREWQLQRTDLSGFINAAEWPLNPGIGSGPTINFVLFVPSKDQSPLVIAETGGNSWLIPQWGGVQILNPSGPQPERLTSTDLEPVMLTFADQLSALLGLPASPPSLALRISSLTRERATSIILSASSTLGALARLSLKLQSISIPKSVAASVDETIHQLGQACHALHDGCYHQALEHARTAEDEAEQAFFEPSMVGQVYFPDEHKVAVYVPLLGPMAVPLVMAFVKELRAFTKRLREKKDKKGKDE